MFEAGEVSARSKRRKRRPLPANFEGGVVGQIPCTANVRHLPLSNALV